MTSSRSRLQVYLDESRLPRSDTFDVLKWWEANEQRYPDLACMARDILSIPITTVASESAFSLGGRVLTKLRHNLLPENAEALITTKSWLSSGNISFLLIIYVNDNVPYYYNMYDTTNFI